MTQLHLLIGQRIIFEQDSFSLLPVQCITSCLVCYRTSLSALDTAVGTPAIPPPCGWFQSRHFLHQGSGYRVKHCHLMFRGVTSFDIQNCRVNQECVILFIYWWLSNYTSNIKQGDQTALCYTASKCGWTENPSKQQQSH